MATTLTTSGLGYLFWLLAARLCSATSVGKAAALISALTLVSLLSNLGAFSAIVYRLPQQPDITTWSRTLTSAFVIASLASAMAATAAVAILWSISSGESGFSGAGNAALFIVCATVTTSSQTLDYAWLAQRRAHVMFMLNLIFAVAKLVLLVPLRGSGSSGIVLAWTSGAVLATCVSLALLWLWPHYRFVFRGIVSEMRAMRRLLVGHHAINLGTVVPLYLVPVLVGLQEHPRDTAHFFAAWRFGTFFVFIAAAVSAALFAEGSNDLHEIRQQALKALGFVSLLLVPVVAFTILLGRPLLGLFGPGYDSAYSLLVLLAAAAIPDAVPNVYGAVYRVEDRLAHLARINWLMATVKIVGTWFLISHFGIAAAGIAWLSAQLLGTAIVGAEILSTRQTAGAKA